MTADPIVPRASSETIPVAIVPGVWRVGGGSWGGAVRPLSAEADANVYLLHFDGATVLADCGTRRGYEIVVGNVERLGRSADTLTDLLLTHSHWDHSDAAGAYQERLPSLSTHLNATGAEFLTRGDHRLVGYHLQQPPYDFQPFRVDHSVNDGETFLLGRRNVTAHFMPGHTPDSTVFTLEHADATLAICGDVVFGPRAVRKPVLGQLCTLWLSHLDHYVESLRRLTQIPIDILLPGHGRAVLGRSNVQAAAQTTLALAESLAADMGIRENVGI